MNNKISPDLQYLNEAVEAVINFTEPYVSKDKDEIEEIVLVKLLYALIVVAVSGLRSLPHINDDKINELISMAVLQDPSPNKDTPTHD